MPYSASGTANAPKVAVSTASTPRAQVQVVHPGDELGPGQAQELIAALQVRAAEIVGTQWLLLDVGAEGAVVDEDALAGRVLIGTHENRGYRAGAANSCQITSQGLEPTRGDLVIAFRTGRKIPASAELHAVGVCSDDDAERPEGLDWGVLDGRGFEAKAGQVEIVSGGERPVAVVGLGPADKMNAAVVRRGSASLARSAKRMRRIAVSVLDAVPDDASTGQRRCGLWPRE